MNCATKPSRSAEREQQDDAHQHRQGGGDGGHLRRRAARGDLPDLGGRQDADGRRGADAEPARIAEDRIGQHRQQRGVETGLHREARQRRVGHRLGDDDRRGRDPRDDVRLQPPALVRRQPAQRRNPRLDERRDRHGVSRSYGEAGGGGGVPGADGADGGGSGCQPPPSARYNCANARQLIAASARELQLLLERAAGRRSGLPGTWTARGRIASATAATASRSATTPASCSVAYLGQLLDGDQRVGDFAVRVERGLLVLRDRLIEPRLGRLVVPLDPLSVEQRLEQSRADRPDHRVALQEVAQDRRSPCRTRPVRLIVG